MLQYPCVFIPYYVRIEIIFPYQLIIADKRVVGQMRILILPLWINISWSALQQHVWNCESVIIHR